MKSNKRYLVLLGAIILQICLGSIYTWSIFNTPLSNDLNWDVSSIVLTFSIAIFSFSIATIPAGRLLKRIGPRKVATIGGILYGLGVLLTGFVLAIKPSLVLIYFTYGILGGLGVGFAYVCPVATLVKWFPESKATITGIGVGAFGLGSVLFKPIVNGFVNHPEIGAEKTFILLGFIYLILCVFAAQLFSEPEKKHIESTVYDDEFTIREMIKTPAFPMMWLMFFLGCMPGLLAISIAVNIGMDYVLLSSLVSGNAVVLIAVFNTFGRLASGALADRFGLRKVITALFSISVITVVLLMLSKGTGNSLIFFTALAGIATGFGGLLAVVPSLVGEFYGIHNLGSNYGVIFIAYGLSALVGSLVLGHLDYDVKFIISVSVAAIGLILSLVMKKPRKV